MDGDGVGGRFFNIYFLFFLVYVRIFFEKLIEIVYCGKIRKLIKELKSYLNCIFGYNYYLNFVFLLF